MKVNMISAKVITVVLVIAFLCALLPGNVSGRPLDLSGVAKAGNKIVNFFGTISEALSKLHIHFDISQEGKPGTNKPEGQKVAIDVSPDKDSEITSVSEKIKIKIPKESVDTQTEISITEFTVPASTGMVMLNNFELTETEPHKVLLFTGDAQVGNWVSWQQVDFSLDEEQKEKITGAELLNKTIFYKVGHHGSRNATLREKGLEMMDKTDLVVMLPVDEEWAKTKMRWEHPATNLLARLKEKSKNRVLRTDKIKDLPGDLKRPDECSPAEWKSFLNRINWDKSSDNLWVEYTL